MLPCRQQDSPVYDGEFCAEYRKVEFRGAAIIATSMSGDYPQRIQMLCGEDGQLCRDFAAEPWQVVIDAAEEAYDRSAECKFTSFVGYEYSGSPNNSNYHRNVIFRPHHPGNGMDFTHLVFTIDELLLLESVRPYQAGEEISLGAFV